MKNQWYFLYSRRFLKRSHTWVYGILAIVYTVLYSVGCEKISDSETQLKGQYGFYKDSLIAAGKRIYEKGLSGGTGGDISVRVPTTDIMLIKATGQSVGDLKYGSVAECTISGDILTPGIKPSMEYDIHAEIYQMRSDVNAIMHMHAPYATAFAAIGKKIPLVTQQSKIGLGTIALIPFAPVGSRELTDHIVNAYRDENVKVVIMQNHGVFIIGKDLFSMIYTAELVEETAETAFISQQMGTIMEFDIPPQATKQDTV